MMDNLEKTYLNSFLICAFKSLKNDSIFKNFIILLENLLKEDNLANTLEGYSNFVFNLKNQDFSCYLNSYIKKNNDFSENQIEKELKIISSFTKINFKFIKNNLIQKYPKQAEIFENLAYFSNSETIFTIENVNITTSIDDIFEKNRAFIFDDYEIIPIEFSENINFKNLKGYEEQKRVLIENTTALIKGAKVNNILLYGDAGCGKSSSVRALLNEFEEIKIIQIFKNNLANLDKLYLKLKDLPYKFIIFADDISFDENDTVLSTMKAIIEGSLVQCPKNVVLYATSNRRHLIKESFSSRTGDEIHLNDTINEISSLSERFGINLFFPKPTNDEFNNIVIELAKDNSINIDENTLIKKAQRMALIKGSRSPRIAKQLIDNLVANIDV